MMKFDLEIVEKIQEEHQDHDLGIIRQALVSRPNLSLEKDLVLAVQGVRRCGKSTLLRQIAHTQAIQDRALFINFEDPRLGSILDHRLLDALVQFHSQRSTKHRYFFFDEIQNVQGWEKWLHIQLEKKKYHFVITGSNSTLLSGKLGSALTGRHLSIELFPFNFSEFKKLNPAGTFEEFLESGGFPRALSIADPKDLLRNYFSDIVERDVRRNINAKSAMKLMQIARAIYESAGSEISLRQLAKVFDSTADTMGSYVDAFEAAYLCLSAPFFSYSTRKSRVRPRKYYPVDLGLRSAVIAKTGLDLGKKLETYIYLRLRSEGAKVYYWRGKREIDFVVESPSGIQPIQVTWGNAQPRHEEAVEEFQKEFPRALPAKYINAEEAKNW